MVKWCQDYWLIWLWQFGYCQPEWGLEFADEPLGDSSALWSLVISSLESRSLRYGISHSCVASPWTGTIPDWDKRMSRWRHFCYVSSEKPAPYLLCNSSQFVPVWRSLRGGSARRQRDGGASAFSGAAEQGGQSSRGSSSVVMLWVGKNCAWEFLS